MIRVTKDLSDVPASLKANPPRIDDSVRQKLKAIYNKKCCYCEDAHIKGTIEHYRPKAKYPHLEFEWANLLLACGDCNNAKNNQFDENCPLINPEEQDINFDSIIKFEKDGSICSDDLRMKKTIETCKLDRVNLNDKRKEVFDDFFRDLKMECEFPGLVEKRIKTFKDEIKQKTETSFIAFRKYIIFNWLHEMLEEL